MYLEYLNTSLGLFSGLFNISSLSLSFGLIILILTIIILNLTGFYPRIVINSKNKLNKKNLTFQTLEQYRIIEYTLIILFIVTGSLLLISSNDYISLYITLELQSYGLYIISTIYRNSEPSTGSGLTYFLLGGLSSCFILLGIGIIYSNSGTTYLDNYYIISNLSNVITKYNYIMPINILSYKEISLLLIIIGLLFKISAAPFHFWSPDVYDGLPTIVTTLVAILPKLSLIILLYQLLHYINNKYYTYEITNNIIISSVLSLIIGTVLGLNQLRIKRLLAYSTISHIGFILLALSINSVESIQSFIFYIVQYSFSNLNTFFILIAIGYNIYLYINKNNRNDNLQDKTNSPIQLLSQLKGYYWINPILALSLAITLFSFAGIPPLIGFFGKLFVLSAALQNGYIFLALIIVITSVIGAVYYLNVIKLMFFEVNRYKYSIDQENKETQFTYIVYLSNALSISISIITLIISLFMFIPNHILHWSNILSIISFSHEPL